MSKHRALALGLVATGFLTISVSPALGEATPAAPPVVVTDSLTYQDLKVGTGPALASASTAVVHYTGWLAVQNRPGCSAAGGKKFDSSRDRGKPFEFKFGAGQVIKGWELGLAGMRVGGRRLLTIPPQFGYGDKGVEGVIPPGATLSFDVELLQVKQGDTKQGDTK